MPKAFTETEKERIRAQLMERGMTHFSRTGVRAARVGDICADVGIAKGSFYAFFASKEDLFMAIADDRDLMHKRDMMAMLKAETGNAPAVLGRFFDFMRDRTEGDPVLRVVRDRGEILHLMRKVSPEHIAENNRRDHEFMRDVSALLQSRYQLPCADAQTLENLLAIMLSVALQEEHFKAAGTYDATMALLRDMFVARLVEGPKS
ncbi:MAG: TetR/AcrR family transcriptional regulator [Hyphomicrobiaceae bacterium]|nr:TetR/AcrR family transcriptional regulator [Hyphomicrobiaceae bacterium]MCC0025104.1 TetR/AcrR family transcriptional regulator [Hyphomicrobiaceae bacterium]